MPAKLADEAVELLRTRDIDVVTGCLVKRVTADGVEDADGHRHPADLCVWTAGIEAPPFLRIRRRSWAPFAPVRANSASGCRAVPGHA